MKKILLIRCRFSSPCRSEDYNDRMEQRERDKKSRQILSQQYLSPETTEEMPLFNAPYKVDNCDDKIQRSLGSFEMAMPFMDKCIGVQGPSQLRSSQPPYPPPPHMNSSGYNSSNREGYSNRSHMPSSNNLVSSATMSSSSSSSAAASAASVPGFLKPKEAAPLNGMSRYNSSSSQHGSGHNNRPMHDVSTERQKGAFCVDSICLSPTLI